MQHPKRLASYRPLSEGDISSFYTILAELGYAYSGRDYVIKCEVCKSPVLIHDHWAVTKARLKHERGCPYETSTQQVQVEFNLDSSLSPNTPYGQSADDTELNYKSTLEDNKQTDVDSSDQHRLSVVGKGPSVSASVQKNLMAVDKPSIYTGTQSVGKTKKDKHSGMTMDVKKQLKLAASLKTDTMLTLVRNGVYSLDSFYTSASASQQRFFHFGENFIPEHIELVSKDDIEDVNSFRKHCLKNAGHFGYFTVKTLTLEQIPSKHRCLEIVPLLKIMADLTVRINLTLTSHQKKDHASSSANRHKIRMGTGHVIEYPGQESSTDGQTSTLKTMFPWLRKKSRGLVYIQTSRDLVFDDEEACSALVEFFVDDANRKYWVTLKGHKLLVSPNAGENQCLLVCKCSDPAFVQKLNQLQQEFYETAERLPLKVKKGMLKKLFMIHHPHGGPKMLSYGDYIRVKYRLNPSDSTSGKTSLVKVKAQDPDNTTVVHEATAYRKALHYAADTCPGSSGAPIVTFTLMSKDGLITPTLDIWMHHGVETAHKLGTSTLKVATPMYNRIYNISMDLTEMNLVNANFDTMSFSVCNDEDFKPIINNETQNGFNDDDSENESSLGQQKVNSPVYKVISKPAHPKFIMNDARMGSYRNKQSSQVVETEVLSSLGFFSSEETGSLVCFQCGLTVSLCRSSEEVKVQHERDSPTCPYHKSLKEAKDEPGASASNALDSFTSSTEENLPLKLLMLENKELMNQLKCKICSTADIKDVFLPCGELYACSDCSKLLTHCPSCGKAIMATITVYLT